jgi:hypothetical protein
MQSQFVNTGFEPIQFLVFVAAISLILAFVRRLPFVNFLSFFHWIFSYPVLSLLVVSGAAIAFGLFGRDYGLEYCFYPDDPLQKFAAAMLLMILFCETIALGYLRDHVDYERSPSARARANATLIRTWIMLRQWLSARWLVSCLPESDDDAWLRYLRAEDVEVLGRSTENRATCFTDWPGRRLKATLAVVATQGTLLMLLITFVVVLAVTIENWGHLTHEGNLKRIWAGLASYLIGLPFGLLISVGLTALVAVFIPGATAANPVPREDLVQVRWRRPAVRPIDAALGFFALSYLVLAFANPLLSLWLVLAILMFVVVWLIRGWLPGQTEPSSRPRQRLGRSLTKLATSSVGSVKPRVILGTLSRAGASTRPGPYAISMLIFYLFACVIISFMRTWNIGTVSHNRLAFLISLILSLILTIAFVFRTRLGTPESTIAIPSLILQGFLAVCVVYMFGGRDWWIFSELTALAITCLVGAAVALVAFISYLLRGRLAAGAMACLLLAAYIEGLAIDEADSNYKLQYSDLKEYYRNPVVLDTRDYFTSSYGKVLRLDRKVGGRRVVSTTVAAVAGMFSPKLLGGTDANRIGTGLFEIDGDDLLVDRPGDKLVDQARPVVIRMPRRLTIEFRSDPASFLLKGVERKHLKNAAILWKNPPSRFDAIRDKARSRQDRGARYALFPLWPDDVAHNPRDRTLCWPYHPENAAETEWSVKIDGGQNWQKFMNENKNEVLQSEFFLVGNWYFDAVEDLGDRANTGPKSCRYRVRGAAADGYFPDLWWRPGEDRSNLGLRRPRPSEASEGADLQVTLTVPVPLGDYRVVKNEPGDAPGTVRVLISTPAEGMEPRKGTVVNFSPGGVLHGPHSIEECRRVSPLIAPREGRHALRASEPRPAAVILVRKLPEPVPGTSAIPQAALELDNEEEARAKKSDAVDTWESQATNDHTSSEQLLDNMQVLEQWKNSLNLLPTTTARRVTCRMCPMQHSATCSHRNDLPTADDPQCECPRLHKLVLVTVSGGGIRSAVWAATVLRRLEESFGPAFPYHIRIITGASGGMVGATYYAGTIRDPGSLKNDLPGPVYPHNVAGELDMHLGECDFLSPTASHMVFSDVPRVLTLPLALDEDRGEALEHAWEKKLAGGLEVFHQPFRGPGGFAKDEKAGWRPSLIFTPMLVEDGRRLLISNLDLSFAPRNVGAMMLDADSSLLRPQINQFGAFVDGGVVPGSDLYSLTAVEFFRLFPRASSFRVGTAARMSATFPLISPAVTLPTLPPRSVVDAGYYDNFGINLVSLWTDRRNVKQWLVENTSGVLILQIRDHASQLLRTELDYELRSVGNPVSDFLMGPDVAAITGDVVHAIYDRGLLQLARPLNGFFSSRYAVTSFRNDEQIESLSTFLGTVPPTAAEIRGGVHQALEQMLADHAAGDAIKPDTRRAELSQEFDTRLSQLRLDGRPFPYTTVVFECPIQAALSWELTASESHCIRMGMGRDTGDVDPRDYPTRDALLHEIRKNYSEDGHHLKMAGRQLDRVCFNVLHNLQRLGFLKKWCLYSHYEPFQRPAASPATGGVR